MSFVQTTNQGTDLRQSPLTKYTSITQQLKLNHLSLFHARRIL